MRRFAIAAIVVAGCLPGAAAPGFAQDFDRQARVCADGSADPDLHIGACTWLIQSGRLAEHDIPAAFYSRGNAYANKGQQDRAIQDFDQAIRLRPDYAEAFINRGNVYSDKGQRDRAIQDFDQAIRLRPDHARAFYNRGVAYGKKGQYDRAIQDYDQAIRLKPDYAFAFYNRGNANSDKGQQDRAIQDFDQAIRLRPDHAAAFYNRGNAYRNKGQYDRAIQDYDQAIRLKPDHAGAFYNRGTAHFVLGRFAPAARDIASASDRDPKDPYRVLSLYLAQRRGGGDGRAELERRAGALDLAKWPGAVVKLYLGQTTPDDLRAARATAVDMKPEEWRCEASFYLGMHLLLAGDRAGAEALLREAVATGATRFVECEFARAELTHLGR